MVKCYSIAAVGTDIHQDKYCKLNGISIRVIIPQGVTVGIYDLVSCRYYRGRYVIVKVYKNKNIDNRYSNKLN